MNTRILTTSLLCLIGFSIPSKDAYSRVGRLNPKDFNQMYHLATLGKVGNLRNAVNRGLNIDATNPNGDTGLCIAVKRKNYIAYNSFRMSGANPRHPCTYKIYNEYQEFLNSTKTVREERILGNKESLYYNEKDAKVWPWVLGVAAIGGGALALSGGGGGSSPAPVIKEDHITPIAPQTGLTGYITNYHTLVENDNITNILDITYDNNTITDPNTIQLLPNALDMSSYLSTFALAKENSTYDNWGTFNLSDGVVGLSAHGTNSIIKNNGNINISAVSGSIGMAASNGGTAYNGSQDLYSDDNGNINLSSKGATTGNSLIGMYADTNSKIINYGKITATTSETKEDLNNSLTADFIILPDLPLDDEEENQDNLTPDTPEDTENPENTDETTPNAGTLVGMGIFNFYTGTNLSANTVSATNHGNIELSAGYNAAQEVGVSLVGMGSYIDDKFLNQNHNPAYAEQMELNNSGNINLKYQGKYKLSKDALKLGKGGLIGIRADAQGKATNKGSININLTSTTLEQETDTAAAMLSVHGAELINGDATNPNPLTSPTTGHINIINDATSGGVSYGMLAAKGEGSQTRLYNWKAPKLSNYGLIDINVSNSYAMASFDGGDVTNHGIINLGVENGHSYYTNNIGLYSEGKDLTDAANLINKGIINVNSVQSVAMQQMFSGSVDMINDGTIYLSQKATGSKAFAGNFSQGTNNGTIFHKVDNSENFEYPIDPFNSAGWNTKKSPVGSTINISTDEGKTKQDFSNNGVIIIGDTKSDNYNGTFGTAGIQVSAQGTATNQAYSIDDKGKEKGLIWLKSADTTYRQLNAGMYLDKDAKRAASIDNKGKIVIDANNSTGLLNMSTYGATAFNNGDIYVNGKGSYGIAGTKNSYISNGSSKNDNANIYLLGQNSIGMYINDAEAFNFGNIYLKSDYSTAYFMDGKYAILSQDGTIIPTLGLKEQVFYEATNSAVISFSRPNGLDINGYVFAKASSDTAGGDITLEGNSIVSVKNQYGRLFVIDGIGSKGSINTSVIDVSDEATGAEIRDGGSLTLDLNTNLNVNSSTATGVKLAGSSLDESISGLTLLSKSKINVKNSSLGINAEAYTNILSQGTINVEDGTGIQSYGKEASVFLDTTSILNTIKGIGVIGDKITNAGTINIKSNTRCTGIMCNYSNYTKGIVVNSTAENTGTIMGSNMGYSNMGVAVNPGALFSNKNKGNITSNNIGVHAENSAKVENDGDIAENYIGIYSSGGTITNTGNIKGNGYGIYQTSGTTYNTGEISGNTYGIFATSGRIENSGTINATSDYGAYIKNATLTNKGIINVSSGHGVIVDAGANFSNDETINVGSGTGILVKNDGYASNNSQAKIIITGSGTGVHIEDGGNFDNAGVIIYNSDNNASATNKGDVGYVEDEGKNKENTSSPNLIKLGTSATLTNHGTIDLGNQNIDFDSMKNTSSDIIIAKGGTFKGSSFIGEVIASTDIVEQGFDNTYQNSNSFIGKDTGLKVKSQSYMFDATTQAKEDKVDVILNRKSFTDIVEEKELAEFLELNYRQERANKLYENLKQAENKNEFNSNLNKQTGKNFYANLPRENMAVIRNITDTQKKRILSDGLKGLTIGASYSKIGKDETSTLSDYDTNLYQAYFGNSAKKNKNLSYGYAIAGTYVDSTYDKADATKQNHIISAFLPILYQKDSLKYLNLTNISLGFGDYTRNKSTTDYKADTFDIYYGINNSAEYSISLKIMELVAEAELNLQGISSNSAKEKSGLTLKSHNTLSLEGGIGLKLRKTLNLNNSKSLTFELGSKYYHEFLDPYKKLKATLPGSPLDFYAGYYDETKDRLKTTASATYKDQNISLSTEISHNNETKDNIEGSVDLRYNF